MVNPVKSYTRKAKPGPVNLLGLFNMHTLAYTHNIMFVIAPDKNIFMDKRPSLFVCRASDE